VRSHIQAESGRVRTLVLFYLMARWGAGVQPRRARERYALRAQNTSDGRTCGCVQVRRSKNEARLPL